MEQHQSRDQQIAAMAKAGPKPGHLVGTQGDDDPPGLSQGEDSAEEEREDSPDADVSYLQEEQGLPPSVAGRLVENFDRYRRLAQRDRSVLQEFVERSSEKISILKIPAFEEDIFDMDGLLKMTAHLFPAARSGASS